MLPEKSLVALIVDTTAMYVYNDQHFYVRSPRSLLHFAPFFSLPEDLESEHLQEEFPSGFGFEFLSFLGIVIFCYSI